MSLETTGCCFGWSTISSSSLLVFPLECSSFLSSLLEASMVTESSLSYWSCCCSISNLANAGSLSRLLRFELKRFLMALSVRPSTCLAMSHQRLPCTKCNLTMSISSSTVHLRLVMLGSRWLCHLSRHCFPMRPGRLLATWVQFLAPRVVTIWVKISSSPAVQVPLEKWLQFMSSSQRVWHLISDFPGRSLLMRFHEFWPNRSTYPLSFSSYNTKFARLETIKSCKKSENLPHLASTECDTWGASCASRPP